jgi:hypothetical protein
MYPQLNQLFSMFCMHLELQRLEHNLKLGDAYAEAAEKGTGIVAATKKVSTQIYNWPP